MNSPDSAEPLAVFAVKELPNSTGQLLIFADRLRFEIPDQPPCELLHAEQRDKSELTVGTFYNFLTIKEPKKRTFQLNRELVRAIRGWQGPPTHEDLRLALKRRLAWTMPIGIAFVLLALPLGVLELDVVLCIQGMMLLLIGLLSRLAPQRVYFLLDAIWFLTAAVTTTWNTFQGAGWWWFPFVYLQVALAISGIREYHRFAPERMDSDEASPQAFT